jgi:hypothetical protein
MLCRAFGIGRNTIKSWKRARPQFLAALKEGKSICNEQVTMALYSRAVQGNVLACIYWLKNRRPDLWGGEPKRCVQPRNVSKGLVDGNPFNERSEAIEHIDGSVAQPLIVPEMPADKGQLRTKLASPPPGLLWRPAAPPQSCCPTAPRSRKFFQISIR